MRRRDWIAVLALGLMSGCGACEEVEEQTGPVMLANQDGCVPLEERDDCRVVEETLMLNSADALQMACESSCKLVKRVSIEERVTDLSILNYLEFVDGKVSIGIYDNTELTTLEGMPAYEEMFSLKIEKNKKLKSLEGLESLKHVPHFDIENNAMLESLEGLEGLETVGTLDNPGTGIRIYANPKLKTLDGLSALRETMFFQVDDNPELVSMSALESFERNHRDFDVTYNPKLEQLPQGKLKYAGKFGADVQFNSSLAPCQIEGFFSALEERDGEFVTLPNGLDSPERCPAVAIE